MISPANAIGPPFDMMSGAGGGTPAEPGSRMLLESGSFFLLESGDKLLLD